MPEEERETSNELAEGCGQVNPQLYINAIHRSIVSSEVEEIDAKGDDEGRGEVQTRKELSETEGVGENEIEMKGEISEARARILS